MSLQRSRELRGAVEDSLSSDRRMHPWEAVRYDLLGQTIGGVGSAGLLPDARNLRTGGIHFMVKNTRTSAVDLTLKDYDGGTVATIPQEETWIVCLLDNSTSAGVWHARRMS